MVSLARVVGTDVDTARFYLEEAEGDVRAAHAAFPADESWDEKTIDAAGRGRDGNGAGRGLRGGEGVLTYFSGAFEDLRDDPIRAARGRIELTEKKDQ